MPALDPGRGLFRAKSPSPVNPAKSVERVRSPSPPKVRAPVQVPERFKSPPPPPKVASQLRAPEPAQAPEGPKPVMNSTKDQNGTLGKSTVSSTSNDNIKQQQDGYTNQMDSTDDQGLTRKKVVKVVRRVVKKVLPAEESVAPELTRPLHKAVDVVRPNAEAVKAAPAAVCKPPNTAGFSFKHDVIKTEDKDDMTRGLTSFMVRGRTRDPHPRLHRERPEKLELEKRNEKKEETHESQETKEKKEIETAPRPQEVKPRTSGADPREVKSPVVAVNSSVVAPDHSAPTPSKLSHSKAPPPSTVGFIPAPKVSSLSPPPGFIPAPKPATATKLSTPGNLSSKTTGITKSTSLTPPSPSSQAPKVSPRATAVKPGPAPPAPGPVSAPPAVSPTQQTSISLQEVRCASVCKVHVQNEGAMQCLLSNRHILCVT